jgi:hypothetical protein
MKTPKQIIQHAIGNPHTEEYIGSNCCNAERTKPIK